mgnify:CR=1 FL=1
MPDELKHVQKLRKKDVSKSYLLKEISISADRTIHVDTFKEFIEGAIKDKVVGATKTFNTYTKPYTTRVYGLKILDGYQPPKLQQYDGKGNPK